LALLAKLNTQLLRDSDLALLSWVSVGGVEEVAAKTTFNSCTRRTAAAGAAIFRFQLGQE
jgi:hypothetical protein